MQSTEFDPESWFGVWAPGAVRLSPGEAPLLGPACLIPDSTPLWQSPGRVLESDQLSCCSTGPAQGPLLQGTHPSNSCGSSRLPALYCVGLPTGPCLPTHGASKGPLQAPGMRLDTCRRLVCQWELAYPILGRRWPAVRVMGLHTLLPCCRRARGQTGSAQRVPEGQLCSHCLPPLQDGASLLERREAQQGQGQRATLFICVPHSDGRGSSGGWERAGLRRGQRGRGGQGEEVRKEEGRDQQKLIEQVGRKGVVLGPQGLLFSVPLQ